MRSVCDTGTASAFFYLLGSFIGLVLALWTVRHEEFREHLLSPENNVVVFDDDNDDDDDAFYSAIPYQILSSWTATCYLLDVALDNDRRRSTRVAICFGVGAALELLSSTPILDYDWLMLIAVHAYLASAAMILTQPPDGVWEGRADILFGIGCGFDVVLSYCYWNDDELVADVLMWGDVLSATLWFANALLVTILTLHSSSSCDGGDDSSGDCCFCFSCCDQSSSQCRRRRPSLKPMSSASPIHYAVTTGDEDHVDEDHVLM